MGFENNAFLLIADENPDAIVKTLFCHWKLALSNGVIVFFISVVVYVSIN